MILDKVIDTGNDADVCGRHLSDLELPISDTGSGKLAVAGGKHRRIYDRQPRVLRKAPVDGIATELCRLDDMSAAGIAVEAFFSRLGIEDLIENLVVGNFGKHDIAFRKS